MNVVFIGSGDFAAPILEKLAGSDLRMMAVITAPDRPAGRGLDSTPTPVKKIAQDRGLHLFEPKDVNSFEFIRELNALSPDLIAIADYGQKLGRDILALPRYYCINVHPSLLPRYRGATPIQQALANGDRYTGVTVIRVVERMDAGPIIGSIRHDIPDGCSAGDLETDLARIGGDLTVSVIDKIAHGTAVEIPQDERQATFARKVSKEDGRINWNSSAEKIASFILAMDPYPGAFTQLQGERMKVIKVRPVTLEEPPTMPVGTIVAVDRGAIWVTCQDGVVGILELQPAGGTKMPTEDYVNGHSVRVGETLSS
jgi:methionyl-tRNA formyltransferase